VDAWRQFTASARAVPENFRTALIQPGPSHISHNAPFWIIAVDDNEHQDEKKAHHAVRSNLPRFRLLGSASNIL